MPTAETGFVSFETAAAHACTDVPVFGPTHLAGDVRQRLVGQRYDSASSTTSPRCRWSIATDGLSASSRRIGSWRC